MLERWTTAGTLQAGGKALEYACHGPPPDQAPTLVLLHEGLGSVALWRDFPVRLSEASGLGVMAYSRAGYGGSDPAELPRPVDYMTREAIDVLPDVLDAIGFRSGVLVGHSDGATIAAIYAGTVPDARVQGVVAMAPHFFTEPMGLAEIEKARDAYENTDLRARLAKYHVDPDNAFRGWNDAWLKPHFQSWNVAEVIDSIRVPVLAIQGRQDQYGTLAQIDVIKARSGARVEALVLEECKHAPFLDHPDVVTGAIVDFCGRLDGVDVGLCG